MNNERQPVFCVYCKFFKDHGESFCFMDRFACNRTKKLIRTPIGLRREVFIPMEQNKDNDCVYFVERSIFVAIVSFIRGVFHGK